MTKNTPEIVPESKEKYRDILSSGQLKDLFSRTISYLRVSLTDQCNLRCIYCSPKEVTEKLDCKELLSYEELLRVIDIAVQLGIRKVRLTGGEPLVRRNVISFIRRLASMSDLHDIRLTTNGVMLVRMAEELYEAGIRKLNISLDTLKRQRFRQITGVDCFDQVWQGIERVQAVGFSPIKLNIVALKGINDDEFVDFAGLALSHRLQVRFIEFMPIGRATIENREKYISVDEIKEKISVLGDLEEVTTFRVDGPARVYTLTDKNGTSGRIGFISPISHKFCETCNRLRLTSDGKLRSCLLSDMQTDLKQILRSGGSDDDVKAVLLKTIMDKPKGHTILEKDGVSCVGQMSRIGG